MTTPQRGWKARQNKAIAKRETTDDLLAVRAERAALAAAAAHSSQVEAEARRVALAAARCSCPVCDQGLIALSLAERIITAMARLPHFVPVDDAVMLALQRVASGVEVSRAAFPETDMLSKPRQIEALALKPVEPAKVTPKAEPVVTKPTRKLSAAEVHASADGAILDLDV